MTKWYLRLTADSKVVGYQRAFLVRLCRENLSVKLYWYDGTSSYTSSGHDPVGNDSKAAFYFYDYAHFLLLNSSYKRIKEVEAVALLL